jgi:Rod binding domain-containing protein
MRTSANAQRPNDPAVDETRRVAEEFEAVFLAEMLAPMFESLHTDGLGGGGMGEQIFRPMRVERYAEAISHSGGVGIADSIVRELMRMQEMQLMPEESDDGAAR